MNHATDSLLLAFHDGEVEGSALAELRDHLASCAQCTHELDELRRMSGVLHEALALIDVPAPAPRVRPASAAAAAAAASFTLSSPSQRRSASWARLGTSSLAKAALFLLAFAGVLTAFPGSPTRRALEAIARWIDGPATDEAPAPAIEATPRELLFEPVDGQARIVVHGAREVDVTVRLVDQPKASVDAIAVGPEVTLTSGSGRAEVSGVATGSLQIGIPRGVRRATVEFDGEVLVRLADGALHLLGKAGNATGEEVSFRIAP
jgi:hypothetical protein